jgi:hypothetical protein
MTVEQQIVLKLIRKAIDSSFSWLIDVNSDWKAVVEFALKQGVVGISFDSFQQIRESIDQKYHPNELELMAWFGYTNILEKKYEAHKVAIDKLASFYQQHDIKMMLLKGDGLSLYWPVPKHRPSGDMDIYLFGDWEKADKLVSDKLGIQVDEGHEHHTCFTFEGESIENHYDFINIKHNKSAVWIEAKLKELAGTSSYPSADFNAIFLIRHLGQHFAGEEVTLRQVLDWGFFMRSENKNVNWKEIIPFLKKMEIYDFFCIINSICVKYLGFKEYEFPDVSSDEALVERVMEDILNPEFEGDVPRDNKLKAIAFKTRRFFANGWKRKLVFKEGILNQFWHGSIAHLRHWDTIED